MKGNITRSMTWLHTWVGLLTVWLLILIFFAGTVSFFRDEVTLWTQPGFHQDLGDSRAQLSHPEQIEQAIDYLQQNAPEGASWWVTLSSSREPFTEVSYRTPSSQGQRGQFTSTYFSVLEPNTQLQHIDSKGGHFFYRLHFDLHYLNPGIARWLVCFASLFMLIALISGIIIHKRIFKDLFSWRSGKGLRTWLDSHNLASVAALPFHLMITYTGLVTLVFMLFPYPALTKFDGNFGAFFNAQNPTRMAIEPTGKQQPMLDTKLWLDQVYTNWPNASLARIIIENPGDQNATIKVYADTLKQVQDEQPTLLLNAVTGDVIARANESLSPSETFYDSMIALHSGRLASIELRWLYFIGGVLGLAMLVSGALMWEKRISTTSPKPSFGLKLVRALNLATIMGLPLATCAFFYANRLLPENTLNRADTEIHVFFIVWLSCLIISSVRTNKTQWFRLAALNGLAWALLPLTSAIVTDLPTHLALIEGKTVLWAFDVTFLLVAFCFGFLATKLYRAPSIYSSGIEVSA